MPRRVKIVLNALIGLAIIWYTGDFLYTSYVARRLRAWEASIQRDDAGVQLGCQAYTIGSGSPAVLFIHGINDSPRCYHKMAPALAQQGLTCRVMRLPGFAERLPKYAQATDQDWRAALRREVHGLRQQHDRVVIVAHSLGGALTIACLLQDPQLADAVVLLAPVIEVSNQRSPILPPRAWHELSLRGLYFTRTTYSPFETDCHDPAERDYPGRMVFTPFSIVDHTFHLIDHNRGRASEFRTPMMMVLTKDDQVVDWRAAERFYERASSEQKAIRFLKDSGHMIPVDFGWKGLTDEIAEFVRQ